MIRATLLKKWIIVIFFLFPGIVFSQWDCIHCNEKDISDSDDLCPGCKNSRPPLYHEYVLLRMGHVSNPEFLRTKTASLAEGVNSAEYASGQGPRNPWMPSKQPVVYDANSIQTGLCTGNAYFIMRPGQRYDASEYSRALVEALNRFSQILKESGLVLRIQHDQLPTPQPNHVYLLNHTVFKAIMLALSWQATNHDYSTSLVDLTTHQLQIQTNQPLTQQIDNFDLYVNQLQIINLTEIGIENIDVHLFAALNGNTPVQIQLDINTYAVVSVEPGESASSATYTITTGTLQERHASKERIKEIVIFMVRNSMVRAVKDLVKLFSRQVLYEN